MVLETFLSFYSIVIYIVDLLLISTFENGLAVRNLSSIFRNLSYLIF